MALPISPKIGLNNNCPMLNLYDVAQQVKIMNK